MDDGLVLHPGQLREGVWEGRLTGRPEGASQPDIAVTLMEQPVEGVEVAEVPGGWVVRVPVSPADLSDGVLTYLIRDRRSETRLGSFAIIAGEPLEGDLRAEIELLRAELDMLKKAFRRHCVETAS